MDTVSFFPVILAGNGSSTLFICTHVHSCTLYIHMHSHVLTFLHIHYTPAVAARGASWASWCVNFSPLFSVEERSEDSPPLAQGQTSVGEGEV